MSKKITNEDIQKKLNTLSLNEILSMLKTYSTVNSADISKVKNILITDDLQNRLIENNINNSCPYCKSKNIVSFGKNGNIKRFKCKDCGKTFTLFTNTILEKTKAYWDIWVKVLEMTLNNYPLEHIQETLIKDYGMDDLNYKTVFLWRHKLINALSNMPMPNLSGIIQIDETFFRETQKGSRNLESTVKGETRKPRYGRRPSKYGVMGNEFANVVCMTDLRGYTVSKVIGLGKLTIETFTEEFDPYIDNPSFICTDGNKLYKEYCELKNIPLYVKPSSYLTTLQKNGYETPDWSNPTSAKATEEKNFKLMSKLYYNNAIDYIVNREDLSYKEFSELKNANSLSLARVNQFHSELKRHFERNTKGVSTKYLQDYIGFYTFIRNWKITNNHYPSSNKDAEQILIEILEGKTTYTTKNLNEAKLNLPKVSTKYMELLKIKTKEIRTITKNPYFKYDEEDNVISFEKRKYLDSLPKYKIETLRKKYKIPKTYTRYSIINELLKKNSSIYEGIIMSNMNVRNYVKDEMSVMLEWINSNKWLSDITTVIYKNNTKTKTETDCVLVTSIDEIKELHIEIKIEDDWPLKTKNLTMDAISVFKFKKGLDLSDYDKYKKQYKYNDLEKKIDIKTLGTSLNSSADIVLKKISNSNILLAFNNQKLQSKQFQDYLKNNCNVKVNHKIDYNLNDSWESAFFLISLYDETLNRTRIIGIEDLKSLYQQKRT